jgi:hypothetical protein
LLVLVVVAALIPLAFGLHWWFWPSIPTTSADNVASVEVHLEGFTGNKDDPGNRLEEATVTIADPTQLQALLTVLATARRCSEHKCGNSGTITIRKKDGAEEVLGILPGHDGKYYEFRYGSRINRVNREPFLAVMKSLGVGQVKLSPP